MTALSADADGFIGSAKHQLSDFLCQKTDRQKTAQEPQGSSCNERPSEMHRLCGYRHCWLLRTAVR